MLKIRLQPTGRKKRIFYRIVVLEEGKKRDGRVLARLGYLRKENGKNAVSLDQEKIKFWQEKGAQLTESVRKLIV